MLSGSTLLRHLAQFYCAIYSLAFFGTWVIVCLWFGVGFFGVKGRSLLQGALMMKLR